MNPVLSVMICVYGIANWSLRLIVSLLIKQMLGRQS